MDQSIEVLVSNPVYMAVAVVLAIVILLGVIKKIAQVSLSSECYIGFMGSLYGLVWPGRNS